MTTLVGSRLHKRLTLALDGLEAATERRREADLAEQDLPISCTRWALTDRASRPISTPRRHVRARSNPPTARVARRLDAAIETIRTVIDASEP